LQGQGETHRADRALDVLLSVVPEITVTRRAP
jgi:hypothetical protein